MSLQVALIWAVQALIVFAVSTFLFDALHYLLHRWRTSRFALLRKCAEMHWVHHEFLDRNMRVNPRWVRANLFAHVLPEFLTGIGGSLIFLLIFDWPTVAFVVAVRLVFLVLTIREEGIDFNHMSLERVNGQQNMVWVDANYHAMHHIFPNRFYSSFLNLFDLIFGMSCQFEGRKFAVTGAGGAFGSALVAQLARRGAEVRTLKHGVHFSGADVAPAHEILEWADVLVLSHGAKNDPCFEANCTSFVALIEAMMAKGADGLLPPEVWALGSEAEIHGTMGDQSMAAYVTSKRAFAQRALGYYTSPNLVYRHIVPSSFTSSMGKGPMSAETAVKIALFFIQRGFRYIPVTLTSLAVWNYFRFRFFQGREEPGLDPDSQKDGAANA